MPLQLQTEDDQIVVKDTELVEQGDPETTYTVRFVTRETYQRVSTKHSARFGGRRGLKLQEQIEFAVAVNEELIDYALVSWTGVLINGQPAPCDTVHKKMLDGERAQGLLAKAGVNQIAAGEAARAASFR